MRRLALGLVACLGIRAVPALASHGGPLVARVIGWDPVRQRVYCEQQGWDESLTRNAVYYFDLRSAKPFEPKLASGGRETDPREDSTRAAAIRSLERRLRPLRPELAESVAEALEVREDSITVVDWRVRRFTIDIGQRYPLTRELRVLTFRSPQHVRILSTCSIPGTKYRVAVVSWIGDPSETFYEVQRVVLLGPGAPTPQILDSENGVLPPWPAPHD